MTLSIYDFDHDGDVDLSDFAQLERCLSGNGFSYAAGCAAADLDGDGDVDAFDVNIFLPCMRGADSTPGC